METNIWEWQGLQMWEHCVVSHPGAMHNLLVLFMAGCTYQGVVCSAPPVRVGSEKLRPRDVRVKAAAKREALSANCPLRLGPEPVKRIANTVS